MELKPAFFDVTLGDKTAKIDPCVANDVLANFQDEFGAGLKASLATRDWLAEQLGMEPSEIDVNTAIEFHEAVCLTAWEMVEQRKKKLLPTANSLLSTLGYQPISEIGTSGKSKPGKPTSPESPPSKPDSPPSTPTTQSRVSRKRKKKSPAPKKKQTK